MLRRYPGYQMILPLGNLQDAFALVARSSGKQSRAGHAICETWQITLGRSGGGWQMDGTLPTEPRFGVLGHDTEAQQYGFMFQRLRSTLAVMDTQSTWCFVSLFPQTVFVFRTMPDVVYTLTQKGRRLRGIVVRKARRRNTMQVRHLRGRDGIAKKSRYRDIARLL